MNPIDRVDLLPIPDPTLFSNEFSSEFYQIFTPVIYVKIYTWFRLRSILQRRRFPCASQAKALL